MQGLSTLDRAQEALRLAEAAPGRAVTLASSVSQQASREGDTVACAVAQRAWGLALRHRGDLDSAIIHLRQAVRLGHDSGSVAVAGEARVTLAFALVERGRSRHALNEIDAALRELDGVAYARALTQRGTILLELGRYSEALSSYRDALPVLREAEDLLWVYRVVWNRGLTYAYRHEFAAAEADLRQAEQLAGQLTLSLSVGFAQANLAFVLGLRGEIASALEYSARAEECIRAHQAQLGELLKDRSELLLSVRLVAEAKETAQQSIAEYEREQRGIKLPQVRLVFAQAALLDGDVGTAVVHARRAAREFTRQQRPEWAALARVTVLRAEHRDGRCSMASLRMAEQTAATLAAARWPAAAMEARLLAATLHLDRGRPEEAAPHLREAARARRNGPATLRARAWYAEALSRVNDGRRRAASIAIRAGLRLLDEHRAVLSATDVRAHAAGHRSELTGLGLRIALENRRPRQVLEWAERGRASELLAQRPARPPDEPVLAQALAELRGIVLQINDLRSDGAGTAAAVRLGRRQIALERQIRDHFRHRHEEVSSSLPEPVPASALAAQLGTAALLELVVLDGTLHAITLVAGSARLHRLGPVDPINAQVDRIGFALHRLLRRDADADSRAAARGLLRHAAGQIDALLLAPLPELTDRPLVIIPTGPLQCLPWAVLPSCAGRPVTVSPSATLWHASRGRAAAEPGRVVVAAGPTLPGAAGEARAVAAVHGVTPMLPPTATVESVLGAIDGAALVHLAAHGRLAAHNPLFSDLLLADGPLLAYDVERLSRPPHTVVLAACDSGRSVVCAGDELLGLSAMFLASGTAQIIAPVLPVLDVDTAPVMVAFHQAVAAGLPAADALAAAQEQMSGDDAAMAVAAGFVSLGAGFSSALPQATGR
ncbi:MAG: CHAT domain-containing protein [Pseudonocardia sp.]